MSFTQPPHPTPYVPQQTLQYSTFIKRAIVESLQDSFDNHPSTIVNDAKVALDFTMTKFKLPAVIIKFYEREMPNAGVGHVEWLPSPTNPDPLNPEIFIKYYHRLYKGDISLEIWSGSAVDRDLIRDALIEVLTMTDATDWGYTFIQRLYFYLNQTPYGLWHFPVLNLDLITGYGEQQTIAPWAPEDQLVYQVTYRVPIFGEFYSNTPQLPAGTSGLVREVDVTMHQYFHSADPADIAATEFYTFTGWPDGAREI